jgi:hypothetical protein
MSEIMNRLFLAITLLALCQGCGETKLETQQGLQEQNAVLQDQVQSEKQTIADLRRQIQLELGAVRREKLALQELVDREPRIAEAHAARSRLELTVLALLLGASLLLLGFLAVRHRGVRERLHLLLMQRVAEMRHLGHSHE